MMNTIRIVPLLIAVMAMTSSAQRAQSDTESDREFAQRVAPMAAQLRVYPTRETAETSRPLAEFRTLTTYVQTEVDKHIQRSVAFAEGSQHIQARLRTMLSDHVPNPEFGDLPFAQAADLRAGQSLVVAYTIVRGPHFDVGTIRGYRWDVNRFELVGTAGAEFEEFNMFKAALRSPVPGELWLLVWGQAHTFNGRKVRVRVYAFDGQNFRSVWSPEDLFDASVHLTTSGFEIDHTPPSTAEEVHDEYSLSVSGPVKKH